MLDNAYAESCTADPRPFGVRGHAGPDEIVLVCTGEADVAAAPLLAHALTQMSGYGPARVSVDLSDLEFIDTHCLAIIFSASDQLRDRGAELVLRSPRPAVRRLLSILQREDLVENA
jgi:anti-anti-sigma factor